MEPLGDPSLSVRRHVTNQSNFWILSELLGGDELPLGDVGVGHNSRFPKLDAPPSTSKRLAVESGPPGQWTTRRLAPDGTCPPSSGLEAYFTQRLRSNARQYCRGRNYVLLALDVRGLQDFGVKHVAFPELWLEMAYLELSLGMTDKHEEFLSCGSSWRVLSV
ncbi:hypothetical protein DEO72_LG6g470 [Vigna unguiculata]|uniref:Uncharacterized protein n=1 Tax=Vigna unguiculata TaxID=3917 RepID=A0A4D6M729_VIGUN|nr:hypothetical protein DEO72_LG6g470 [Vigna unguiculata]